jgi:hypothetical protein
MPGRSRAADLLVHHPLELLEALAVRVAELPVERDAVEVCVGHVQLGLERLRRGH